MIKKPSTSRVMEVFESAVNKSESLRSDINAIKESMEEKLAILNAQTEYMGHEIQTIKDQNGKASNKIVLASVETKGDYDSFGITIHPKLVKTPRSLFNFKTTTGYIFKDNVTVTVNGTESDHLKEALKHDSISGKKFYVDEYDTDALDIVITPDPKNTMGSMAFNLMEIVPFLPNSFHIEYIKVYESGVDSDLVMQQLNDVKYVAAQRLVFNGKTDISRIEMRIRLLHRGTDGKYVFGLKHLYLCEANFRNDSYVVARYETNSTIAYIYDDCVIKSQFGVDTNAKCSENGIEFYTDYSNSVLSHEIEISTATDPNYIAANTKVLFVKIPVDTAIISLIPHVVLDSELSDDEKNL